MTHIMIVVVISHTDYWTHWSCYWYTGSWLEGRFRRLYGKSLSWIDTSTLLVKG